MQITSVNYNVRPTKEGFYLVKDNWNDFGYYTLFNLYFYDGKRKKNIGLVKICTKTQEEITTIPLIIENELETNFFSLGQSSDYYLNINKLGFELKEFILKALNDVAYDLELLNEVKDLHITKQSLLREVYLFNVKDKFNRIINNGAELTKYEFKFLINDEENLEFNFKIDPFSNPPSNIHAIIGSNGVGKTTILKKMADSLIDNNPDPKIYNRFIDMMKEDEELFANVIFISFSAFDSGGYYRNYEREDGIPFYSYIGLRKFSEDDSEIISKSPEMLSEEFVESIKEIINSPQDSKFQRWKNAIETLESDLALKNFDLKNIKKYNQEERKKLFLSLSSGHKIIILILTRLIEKVAEKTLVLIDEPESHLHPPLLSSFMNAISKILINQNGVCIMATHSPVVMQELSRECVSIIKRGHEAISVTRPNIDTYGENVGTLTREVFNLEVTNTGFYLLLKQHVNQGYSYDGILSDFNDAIGLEGRTILRSLIKERELES
jgi:ABC-type cobalamin/Fe3+-siderophores transport system ATPase subunit